MEISPIAGIRVAPMVKAAPADPELSAVFDVEGSDRAGDDSYTASGSKSGGQDEDEDEVDLEPLSTRRESVEDESAGSWFRAVV